MGNMSYCRFENTARDLADCVSAVNRGEIDELNEYEIEGLLDILSLCNDMLENEDYIHETIEDDE
tara:strand:+ start:636 stop:830 length:195 start_codon:yes stop_codon:yes gene_type:complete